MNHINKQQQAEHQVPNVQQVQTAGLSVFNVYRISPLPEQMCDITT